jgi:hypothetical protein
MQHMVGYQGLPVLRFLQIIQAIRHHCKARRWRHFHPCRLPRGLFNTQRLRTMLSINLSLVLMQHMVGHQGLPVFRFLPTMQAIRRHCKARRGRHFHPCRLPRGLFNTQQLRTMLSINLSLVLCGLHLLHPLWVLVTPVAAAWPMPPGMSPHSAFAGYTPWQHPTHQPPPIEILGYPGDTAQAASRGTHNVDHVDPFAEGPHCTPYSSPNLNCRFLLTHSVRRTDGPVLEPFLAKIVGATITLNPLLAPPADSQDDYLRWNMLFHTSNCYRTTEPQRSWVKGRNAPATHPRLTHVCIISRAFPWMIYARAHNPTLGVTCGEVLDAVSMYMYRDVPKEEYENVPAGRKREIRKRYRFNRSTDPNAPGGRLGEGLKRLDWLSSTSSFGGLVVADDTFVKAHCVDRVALHVRVEMFAELPVDDGRGARAAASSGESTSPPEPEPTRQQPPTLPRGRRRYGRLRMTKTLHGG